MAAKLKSTEMMEVPLICETELGTTSNTVAEGEMNNSSVV